MKCGSAVLGEANQLLPLNFPCPDRSKKSVQKKHRIHDYSAVSACLSQDEAKRWVKATLSGKFLPLCLSAVFHGVILMYCRTQFGQRLQCTQSSDFKLCSCVLVRRDSHAKQKRCQSHIFLLINVINCIVAHLLWVVSPSLDWAHGPESQHTIESEGVEGLFSHLR